MRKINFAASLKAALGLVCVLPFAAALAFGQQQVNLTAAPATATLPDGSQVPMWGYSCQPLGAGVTSTATCAALNKSAGTGWSPVVITVPTGQTLQINLTNSLTFANGNKVPTSLTIVGQLGGGLGGTPTTTPAPNHVPGQSATMPAGVTWPTAASGGGFTPPVQGPRVQSFATEVAAGATTQLTWTTPLPGTYLIESGTHPSIQGPMGLYGMLVVTAAPAATSGTETAAGTAYPANGSRPPVTYDAELPLLLSEIDPVQNNAVATAVNTSGFLETNVWSGQPGMCGNPTAPVGIVNTCYPPAVNYTPLYYLFNGVAFDKTHATSSLFAASPTTLLAPPAGTTSKVLVRFVNAGSHMHVPSIVGSSTGSPAVGGFSLIAEDGNQLPGIPRVQNEVFMAAGKTYDVMINAPAAGSTALPVFDRELSLSGNATQRDAGMLAYVGVNGSGLPGASSIAGATARADIYNSLVPGNTLTVSDPSKGVIANDTNVYGAQVLASPAGGTLTLYANGTFTYVPNAGTTHDSFTYCANGTVTGGVCSSGLTATVTLGNAPIESAGGITAMNMTFTANMATYLAIKTPGVLAGAKDAAGYPLKVALSSVTPTGLTVNADANGGFTAIAPSPGTYQFTYKAQNSQGTLSAAATVTLIFPAGSGLVVNIYDGQDKTTQITDYRWIIEEDKTFYVNPNCTANPPPAGCTGPGTPYAAGLVPTFGVNFHTSNMPYVAQGCTGPLSCESGQMVIDPSTGNHVNTVCDVSNGVCRPDTTGNGITAVLPGQVALDPTKRYYLSILPGDAGNPFLAGNASNDCAAGAAAAAAAGNTDCGHGMGGAPIDININQGKPLTVWSQPSPFPPGRLSVFVFEDDFPLNGEVDGGGGVDVLAPQEPGLGGFQIHLWDAMGGNGDFTGQMTYDMFNQPLSNSLAGTIDPATGQNACPLSPGSSSTFSGSAATVATDGTTTININGLTVDGSQMGNTVVMGGNTFTITGLTLGTAASPGNPATPGTWTLTPAVPGATVASGTVAGTRTQPGITGMIVTCPKFEADGITLSPLAGQAVVANLMPGRWGVVASPAADRIARGEEWLQTNTLDGQKAHDVFTRIGEPSYFQEYGPANFHVTIGFANPAIINARLAGVCSGQDANLPGQGGCTNTIKGKVTGERLSRTPDERLYDSGSRDTFYFTQCYVSVGDPDGEDFAFTKCDADGNFTFTGIPTGNWRVTTFDQWNDQLVDGLSTPVAATGGTTINMGDIATTQWQTNLYTRTFIDDNKNGVSASDEAGIPFANVAVRLRDGSLENLQSTDFTGTANFNETFPLFSWYVVETDVTRYKNTGTHVVYDAGGPADGSAACTVSGYPACGKSTAYKFLANTNEPVPVPSNLRVPGAFYCVNADCSTDSILNGPAASAANSSGTGGSTGRIDPPWVGVEGWQGFPGQNNFLEFGKEPYAAGENGGIKGHVIYASTRPFDDPQMLVQTQWEPLVPHVTINLYQEGTAPDGSQSLKLVDTTQTSSFDDFAQGFRSDGMPNMNCPGQTTTDLFYFTLYNQSNYLNTYDAAHGGQPAPPIPYNSQYKCYDGMHNWNQIQPAPYDGMYKFPSVAATDPVTGRPTATNCMICTPNNAVPATDLYAGLPMLPVGKYVVEVVVPPGYELVKEEDKNILIGDNFIAPVTQQFGGLGNIFIIPDQASVASAYNGSSPAFNANNAQNPTQSLGASPNNSIVPGFVPEPTWPCVGEARIVPDYISLFPQTQQVAPFAGATRNLCDRKEVTLGDQMGAIAKFYVYTSTHIASKFTGGITDDFTSEFDPFSPQFGEKFAPPNLPISVKDWTGTEISRVYADQWGSYNGMTYSTWEVNPPNPTGYSPSMMIFCMNDPGTGTTPDPLFQSGYSQFCYELPFMPGTTQYLDTPVVPTAAFSEGYNHPDCAYPAATPAISEVDGDSKGPWVAKTGNKLTITALGDQVVSNYGYSGPSATTAPFNQKTITRHYGFGGTTGSVKIGGIAATVTSWSDSTITVTVPNGVPQCAVQQQKQYGGPGAPGVSTALCGQLLITAANGQQSIDTVTVTIGGKTPRLLTSTAPMTPTSSGAIQQAIDAAQPGDLIMVPPGTYNEMLIMWKPVRLQGVGASSTIINANTQPAGKLDPWRAQVACLFGLSTNGQPATGTGLAGNNPSPTNKNPFDPTGAFTCGTTPGGTAWAGFSGVLQDPQVDRLPLEGILGWDTTVNGNLAQLLQEPTLMGAYEGSGILVLSKGVRVPANSGQSYYGSGSEAAFPTGTVLLTNSSKDCGNGTGATNPYPSNFSCNPSAIDGLSVTDSSQGGGGIFVHAWGHNLQIANNRVYNNIGTLSGGINIGQGESPDGYLNGTASDSDPGSCNTGAGLPTNTQLPYCFDMHVNIHNNAVTSNTSIGDELFSGTPAGAGGVSVCTGADYYLFDYNWVCGNMSTGDGGGFSHLGYIWNGDIEHNTVLFNQSLNPTISTNGGGIIVMGAAPDGFNAAGVECGGTIADADCPPGLPDGTGPSLVINANLIMGNAAESGSGGGLRLQSVNGTEIALFPAGTKAVGRGQTPPSVVTDQSQTPWNFVKVTNNIIANNVAGWDGAGVSLQDALAVDLINNTIMSNDTTASAGVLFNTLGAPDSSSPNPTCNVNCGTLSHPQPAGIVAVTNSGNLTSTFSGLHITCPAGHPNCTAISNPYMANDVFWQNRSFYIGVGALSATYQQNVVSLFNAVTGTPAPTQGSTDSVASNGGGSIITGGTGACPAGATSWDLGVRGDAAPGGHQSGYTLTATYSLLTNASENAGTNNITAADPQALSQYCNGSRMPPEFASGGYNVPPGISDATVPNPIFNLTPSATVDEGNNWVNMTWGPLSMTNPVTNTTLGNYSLASTSPAVDHIPNIATSTWAFAPSTDFFGNKRPDVAGSAIDIGAVEYQGAPAPSLLSIVPNTGARGYSVGVTLTGANLTGTTAVNVSGADITVSNVAVVNATTVTATFAISQTAALTARTVSVTTPNGTSNTVTFTVVRPPTATLTSINPNTHSRGASVPVTITGTSLLSMTSVNVSGTGITVTNAVAVNDTTVTATFIIAANATISARTVSVTTGAAANSNNITFTVTGPVLTSIAPNTGMSGTAVPVTLTGTGLTGATSVTVSGTGVTASAVVPVNDTTVTATLTLTAAAAQGARTVAVVTPIGTTNTVTFTVTGPTLTSIAPNTGARGTSVPVTLTGTNLTGASAVAVSGGGITVSGVTAVNATTVTATFTIASNAALGPKNVTVTATDGTTNAVTFTVVNPPAPTLASISPTVGTHNTAVVVTLTGTNFTATGSTINVSGNGITISGITVNAAGTQITATLAMSNGATRNARTVSVTTPGGTTANVTFTVN